MHSADKCCPLSCKKNRRMCWSCRATLSFMVDMISCDLAAFSFYNFTQDYINECPFTCDFSSCMCQHSPLFGIWWNRLATELRHRYTCVWTKLWKRLPANTLCKTSCYITELSPVTNLMLLLDFISAETDLCEALVSPTNRRHLCPTNLFFYNFLGFTFYLFDNYWIYLIRKLWILVVVCSLCAKKYTLHPEKLASKKFCYLACDR